MRLNQIMTAMMALTLASCATSSYNNNAADAPVAKPALGALTEECTPTKYFGVKETFTKQQLDALTPDAALAMLTEGNQRYINNTPRFYNAPDQQRKSAGGQYPFAAIISCMDSRCPVETVFNLGTADVFNVRMAGNVIDSDVLGSVEYATAVVGSKVILILGHSHCGAVKGAIDDVKLGNLTGLLDLIKPAVKSVHEPTDPKQRTSKNHEFVENVVHANVLVAMHDLLAKSPTIKDLVDKGKVKLVGAVYDLDNGHVEFIH